MHEGVVAGEILAEETDEIHLNGATDNSDATGEGSVFENLLLAFLDDLHGGALVRDPVLSFYEYSHIDHQLMALFCEGDRRYSIGGRRDPYLNVRDLVLYLPRILLEILDIIAADRREFRLR